MGHTVHFFVQIAVDNLGNLDHRSYRALWDIMYMSQGLSEYSKPEIYVAHAIDKKGDKAYTKKELIKLLEDSGVMLPKTTVIASKKPSELSKHLEDKYQLGRYGGLSFAGVKLVGASLIGWIN